MAKNYYEFLISSYEMVTLSIVILFLFLCLFDVSKDKRNEELYELNRCNVN